MTSHSFIKQLGSALRRDTPAFAGVRELARLQAASDERQRELDQFIHDVQTEIGKLAAIRKYVARWPEFPDGADLGGDPEAMIVRDIRNLLKEH